ncbi:meiotic sister-chromatid recombination aldehyde dehydrogenase [Fomitopsis serialis]|uniref:meiotic sister-chromatid recombination aldehyde dehydrogenase n=1 Tax=Fomitopsis serialis TaxID=139415 RepID=UPI0020074D43|nr:meiotic sister-chromatid recombination aldehyde dehydrogenase [Neoantrodia serialis]KAH9913364.1 meiotic sister-chromatid recombination aldehyde dehydrogenase [Neoantrodia serialis]
MGEYDEDGGLNFLLPLSLFFAAGIWLVINRFQSFHNRAVPFRLAPPPEIGPRFEAHKIPNPNLESHQLYPELRPSIFVEGVRYITCFDPATGFHLATLPADNAGQITNKIARAADAQKEWKKTSFRDRRRVMLSLKKWLVDNQETCARVACRDTGKTLLDAALGEILTTCSKLDWLINHGERHLRPERRRGNLLMFYKKSWVCYEPLGVVAAIVSWNYPLHNAWSPIIAALFSGNAIVLKCSENVVWSTTWFVNAIRECLCACGRDPELIQLVCCYPEDADAVTRSSIIRHITFIGSEEVGRKVAVAATEHLTPVTLELGGKDPAIIMPHTNLKQWSSLWMRGIFQNAGQNCIGLERLIVHSSQYDELHDIIRRRTEELRCGSALSNPGRYTEELVQLAADAGLEVQGGERYKHPYLEHGAYFTPTVIGDGNPEKEYAQQELFAPVALIIKYETIQEAIDIANGTRQDLPFGGTKSSGYGRLAIVEDRFGWAIQTTIPKQLTTLEFVSGLIGFVYGDSWRTRIESLTQLIQASRR